MPQAGFNVRLLSAGPFVTMTDRFAVAPMLIPIAIDFHAPVGAVAIAATAYYLAYGLAQPFWGFASDRAGRIKAIRISLGATAAACTLSAIAPNLDFLIAARIIAGASVCAVVPTALVYIVDRHQCGGGRPGRRDLWCGGACRHARDQASRLANPRVGADLRGRSDGGGGISHRGRGSTRRRDSVREPDDRRLLRDLPLDDAGMGDGHRARSARHCCGVVRDERIHRGSDRLRPGRPFRATPPLRKTLPARPSPDRAGGDHRGAHTRPVPGLDPGGTGG